MKRLTINVDDLGLAPAVNEAVLRLAQMGRIHSTSLMSLGKIHHHEVAQLRALGIEIGLHLDLTDQGGQGSLKQVMLRSWLRRWQPLLLQALIARQLDAFEDSIGMAPVFVDGHQHVHQFPQVRELLLAELLRRYGNRVLLRSTRPFVHDAKSRLIYWLGGPTLAQLMHSQGLAANRAFGGAYAFGGDMAALRQRWQHWLAAAPTCGAVLMCHPALPSDGWVDEIKTAREREWQWLCSDDFAALWHKYGCVGQSWCELARQQAG